MKKLFIIGGAIVILFAAIIILTKVSNNSKLEDNPYGTKDLDQATIDQLDDKNYQNIILPDELKEKISSGEEVTAYFFSPLCEHCKNMTPKLMPIADEMGVKIEQLNVLEFDAAWQEYLIEATPTMIHFRDGKEVERLVGDAPEDVIKSYFEEIVLN